MQAATKENAPPPPPKRRAHFDEDFITGHIMHTPTAQGSGSGNNENGTHCHHVDQCGRCCVTDDMFAHHSLDPPSPRPLLPGKAQVYLPAPACASPYPSGTVHFFRENLGRLIANS